MEKLNEARFIARRNIKENIFNLAQFEGINTTFPETEAIIESGYASGADQVDILVIIGLKRGWNKVIDSSTKYIDLDFMKNLNATIGDNLVLDARNYRTTPMSVGSVDFKIQPIDLEAWEFSIKKINEIRNPKERALQFLIYSITSQPFRDGNKRTSFLTANAILINNNVGVLEINKNPLKIENFTKALNNYYNVKSNDNFIRLYKVLDEDIEKTEEWLKLESSGKKIIPMRFDHQ